MAIRVGARAIIMRQKTQRPVQFEITEQTRQAVTDWARRAGLRSDDYLFPSRVHESPHLSTRHYARIVNGRVREIGLDPGDLRYPHASPDKGLAHLPTDQEPPGRSATARPYQAGEYRPLSLASK